jgi:hypothetical protein
MDHTGHSTLAEWTQDDAQRFEQAAAAFRAELDNGYIGVLDQGNGHATQIAQLPRDAELVIMRRPIAGG